MIIIKVMSIQVSFRNYKLFGKRSKLISINALTLLENKSIITITSNTKSMRLKKKKGLVLEVLLVIIIVSPNPLEKKENSTNKPDIPT